MSEDWDCDNYIIPLLNEQNKEQLKQLEERKLVEETEIALMKDFFNNNSNNNNNNNDNNNNINDTNDTNKEKTENKKNKPKISKQKENELKQKEISIKLKQKKEQEKKHFETFGDIICDKYDYYYEY